MPKNKVSDPITDQEIAFARLILSGTMSDQRAAEAVGLNPGTAAYTKSKPRVRAYMLEHRAATQKQIVEHHAEGLRRLNLDREQILGRLWEIANLGPEVTRGSMTSQVKALAMIVAIEGMIPNRISHGRAGAAEKQPVPPAAPPKVYAAKWLRSAQEKANGPHSGTGPGHEEVQQEEPEKDELAVLHAEPNAGAADSSPDPVPAPDAVLDYGESAYAQHVSLAETQPSQYFSFVPDTAGPLSLRRNPFARRR